MQANTDVSTSKPKWNVERQTRETAFIATANATALGTNTIIFAYNDGAGNNVANLGVIIGGSVNAANLSINGVSGMFKSNNSVTGVTGNVVTFLNNTFGTLAQGTVVEFDKVIPYPAGKPVEVTYNTDTVLVTDARRANNTVAVGRVSTGWVHFQKKTNADGNVRYIHETLSCLTNAVAANTNSGNTSFGQVFTGV